MFINIRKIKLTTIPITLVDNNYKGFYAVWPLDDGNPDILQFYNYILIYIRVFYILKILYWEWQENKAVQ